MENRMTQKTYHFKYIGIDPGKGGGIVMIDTKEKDIEVQKCPDSIYNMALMFALMIGDTPPSYIIVLIEKVWARPHDGRSSIFKFAQNYGQWEGIVNAHEIRPHHVSPQAWMKAMGCPKKLSKKDRKNYLKELAKKKYPNVNRRITLATADAVLLADYAKNVFDKAE